MTEQPHILSECAGVRKHSNIHYTLSLEYENLQQMHLCDAIGEECEKGSGAKVKRREVGNQHRL